MYCSTSSVYLPRVKIHSVVTCLSPLFRANGNDTFCEKALKYKHVWISQITLCYLKPLESRGTPLFFKLEAASQLLLYYLSPRARGRLPQGCPICVASKSQQPSAILRVLPEYSTHNPCFLQLGQWHQPWARKVCLETRRGVYTAQYSTKKTAKGAQALLNLNKYQQWITSERNLLFFWKKTLATCFNCKEIIRGNEFERVSLLIIYCVIFIWYCAAAMIC